MARFNFETADNYGGNNGGSSFFSLKEDGEIKKVRFMYDSAEDVEGLSLHKVVVNGKERYVNCLREYNSPIDDCPLCKAGVKVETKLYVPIYDIESGKVMLWERGKKFMQKLSSICARFPDVVAHEFEIERHGAKGSTDTTYEIFEVNHTPGLTKKDLPEIPNVIGGIVLNENASSMKEYIATGSFGGASEETPCPSPTPVRRTPTSSF